MIARARWSGSAKKKGLFQCSPLSLPPVRPPPCSLVHSSPRFCSFRPPPHCRSPEVPRTQRTPKKMNGRFVINRRDAKVMGVAAGLADYTGVDPTVIRLAFIAATLLTGPVMVFFYLVAGLVAPNQ